MKPSSVRLVVLCAGAISLLEACGEGNPPRYGVGGNTSTGAAGAGATTGAAGTTGVAGTTGAGGSAAGAGGSATGTAGAGGGVTGTAGTGGPTSDAPILDQTGNPIYDQLTNYRSWLSAAAGDAAKLAADRTLADNMITWQMPHGGSTRTTSPSTRAPWNGTDARSGWTGADNVELGTIDNGATVTERCSWPTSTAAAATRNTATPRARRWTSC